VAQVVTWRYLLLALTYLGLLILTLGVAYRYWHNSLVRAAVTVGAIGAVWEIISEYWYLQDYWRPVTVLPWPSLEDAIYGLGVTGLTACVAALIWPRPWRPGALTWRWDGLPGTTAVGQLLMLFVPYIAVMQLAHLGHVPSIWTATAFFLVCCIIPILLDVHGVLWRALATGAVMAALSFVLYAIALNWVIDGHQYLQQLLIHPEAPRWAEVPVDEIAWNFTRGMAVYCLMWMMSGWTLTPMRRRLHATPS
jgi:hypothetical protein